MVVTLHIFFWITALCRLIGSYHNMKLVSFVFNIETLILDSMMIFCNL